MTRKLPVLLLLLAACYILLAFSWIGYYGSDDSSYLTGVWGWYSDFNFVGKDHWSLRHTVVIPIALLFKWIGPNEFLLVLSTICYTTGIIVLLYSIFIRYFNMQAAILGCGLFATLPLTATLSTTVVPEFAEAFFCLLSLRLFLYAIEIERHRALLLLFSGLSCGLAWLTRETSAVFFLGYAFIFLIRPQIPRINYLYIGAGAAFIAGLELLYFFATTGEPFYRLKVDLLTHLGAQAGQGLSEIVERGSEFSSKVEGQMHGELSRTGNLSVSRALDPFLAIFANQEFMFYFYLAIPLSFICFFLRRNFTAEQKQALFIFSAFGGVWLLFLFFQLGMTLLPRYFLVPCIMILIPTTVSAVFLIKRHPYLIGLIILGLFSTNLIGIYVDNKNPLFAERALVEYAEKNKVPISTDPETARRGKFLYSLAGVEHLITSAAPSSGSLHYYNPRYVTMGIYVGGPAAARSKFAAYQPRSGWVVVQTFSEPKKALGRLIEAIGLQKYVPPEIFRRLSQPNPPTTLYKP